MGEKKKDGLHEQRSRIEFLLPVGDKDLLAAAFDVIDYLKRFRQRSPNFGGFTHTPFRTGTFVGYWKDTESDRWVKDYVALFIVDYHLDEDSPYLERIVRNLKNAISKAYARHGSAQDEVWITVHPILRYA